MNKIFHFPNQLLKHVLESIPENAPSRRLDRDHESCQTWSERHNTNTYRNFKFFKGPQIYISSSIDDVLDPVSCQSTTAFKAQCKRKILDHQKKGDTDDWTTSMFLIKKITVLRTSYRDNKSINYSASL
jgi:hypothetical protein